MENPFDFTGKSVLITGAGRGIGRSAAIAFGSLGANVFIASRTPSELAEVVSAIQAVGARAESIQSDMAESSSAPGQVIDACLKAFHTIDVLVNNAGQVIRKPAVETTVEDWDKILTVNLKALAETCRLALPHLRDKDNSAIVNMSSITGLLGTPGRAAYAASKSAILGYTRVLAKEVSQEGIRVNAVCPGFIDTSFVTPHLADNPEVQADVIRHIPMGRVGTADEAAWPIVFLASRAASYITGQALIIDGGWMLF